MSQKDIMTIEEKITLIATYEEIIEDAKAKVEALKDSIKQKMTDEDLSEIVTPNHVVRWIDVLSSRFDTKRFKEEMGEDAYNFYTKQVASKKFTIA